MSHDWIMQVLRDLHDYALANNLPAIAAKAAETLLIAESELAAVEGTDEVQHFATVKHKH